MHVARVLVIARLLVMARLMVVARVLVMARADGTIQTASKAHHHAVRHVSARVLLWLNQSWTKKAHLTLVLLPRSVGCVWRNEV